MTRTKSAKALLVALLSLAIVIAFMPAMAQSSYAASKLKVSPSKKTISVKKTVKLTAKGLSAKQLKKVKWSTTKAGKKIVKLSASKGKTIKVTGKKAGKAKITAKYGKKKATVTITVKKASTPAPATTDVASVAIDKTSPKVGDTLTATVTPANATSVKYTWMADGTAIANATSSTYTLTAAELGKKITVKVDGENNSTATSAETAAVAPAAVKGLTASQTGAKTITVKSDSEIADTTAFTVARGKTEVTVASKTIAADKKSVTLVLGANLAETEYTVTATPAGGEAATTTFTGAVAKLSDAKAVSDNLIITKTNGTAATAIVKGYNQFGEEVKLDPANAVASKGTVESGPDKDGVIKLTTASPLLYTAGDKVTITFTYANNTKVYSHEFTVAAKAYVASVEFGAVTTDKASLKDSKIYQKNLDDYYIPVVAKDQYGNVLDADTLNAMATAPVQTTGETQSLFVTPTSGTVACVKSTAFAKKGDATVLQLTKAGASTLTYGKTTISLLSIGGSTFTTDVEVEAVPDVDTVSFSVDDLYKNHASLTTLSATDQYGNAVDLFEAGVEANETVLTIGTKTTITATAGTFTVEKSTAKKTVTVKFNPGNVDSVSFTWQSATPKVGVVGPVKVGSTVTAASIKGIKSTLGTTLTGTETLDLATAGNVEFIDSIGETMKKDAAPAYTAEVIEDGAEFNGKADSYSYTVTNKDAAADKALEINTNTGVVSIKNTTTEAASDEIAITLFKGNAKTGKYEQLDQKVITVNAKLVKDLTYSLTAEEGKTLNASVAGANTVGLKITAKDADGNTAAVTQGLIKSITANDSAFEVTEADEGAKFPYIVKAKAAKKAAGTVTVTAIVGAGSSTQTVTVDVPYDFTMSEAKSVVAKKVDTEGNETALTADSIDDVMTQAKLEGYKFYTVDQYGDETVVSKNDVTVTSYVYKENGERKDGTLGVDSLDDGVVTLDAAPASGSSFKLNIAKNGAVKTFTVTVK